MGPEICRNGITLGELEEAHQCDFSTIVYQGISLFVPDDMRDLYQGYFFRPTKKLSTNFVMRGPKNIYGGSLLDIEFFVLPPGMFPSLRRSGIPLACFIYI